MGFSHRRTVVILYSVGITLGGLALVISRASVPLALTITVGTLTLGFAAFIGLERVYETKQRESK